MAKKQVEEIEIVQKEPHLNDVFGLEDWDMYRAFAVENGYVINEISPIITEDGEKIRQFKVVEREIHVPTYEEQGKRREQAYTQEVDRITCHIDRLRDEEQTPEIEAKIEELKQQRAEVVADIHERFPYPEEERN